MKRMLIVLAMVVGLVISGCAAHAPITQSPSYWVRDNKPVPSAQLQKEFSECRGPSFTKEGITLTEYQEDFGSCREAAIARDKHVENTKTALAMGQIIVPGLYLVSLTLPSQNYLNGCVKSKGYSEVQQNRDIDKCMGDRGYVWVQGKEIKR